MAEMIERVIFVTKAGEKFDEGFTYALELASSINAGITVLAVCAKKLAKSYEDMMSAIAFAEEGEDSTARNMVNRIETLCDEEVDVLRIRSAEAGVSMSFEAVENDFDSAISEHLNAMQGVRMVLLSPSIVVKKGLKDLRQIIKKLSIPVVAITKPAKADA